MGQCEKSMSMPVREKILIALSGGVDSSVAALLLRQQGYEVAGAYMKNWINEEKVIGHCPWEEDIVDARRVAEQIGIPFHVVNLMRDYRERVVQYLLDGYARGLTPNPDIMCNREIKFGVFLAWARDHGFSAVASPAARAKARSAGLARSPTGNRAARICSWLSSARKYDWSLFLSAPSQMEKPAPSGTRRA